LLYGCLLLSNAASLLLPGANLTSLIVFGHDHPQGHEFVARMSPACIAAVGVTAVVIAIAERRSLHAHRRIARSARPVLGAGLVGVAAAVLLVLVVPSPAIPVAATGLAAATAASGWPPVRHSSRDAGRDGTVP